MEAVLSEDHETVMVRVIGLCLGISIKKRRIKKGEKAIYCSIGLANHPADEPNPVLLFRPLP